MDDNKRYRLFKLFLAFTILNIFGIFLYENASENGLFRKKPEFYIEFIKSGSNAEEKNSKAGTEALPENKSDAAKLTGSKDDDMRERKVLIIGDSNAYLMSRNEEYYKNRYKNSIYWLAESGASIEFINEDLTVSVGRFNKKYAKNSLVKAKEISIKDEVVKKGITDIVVLLGVNSLGKTAAETLCHRLIKLDEISGAEVHYVSVLPYVNKDRYKLDNNDIIKFNDIMRKKLELNNVSYIDAYGLLAGTDGYENETTDGIHYSQGIYTKIFEKIMGDIVQNN